MDLNALARMDTFARDRLADFLPETLFDAHVHLYDDRFSTFKCRNKPDGPFDVFGMEEYQRDMAKLLPDHTFHVNTFVYPDKHIAVNRANRDAGDAFTVAQLEKDPLSVGEIMVAPGDTVEELEKRLIHPRIRGFKCYHLLANQGNDTFQCSIGDYLPEAAWEVANARGLVITLHMVKDDALSDPDNLAYIQTMAKRYPNAILILAHAARAFASWTGVEAIDRVAHLDNVWYDFAAVCESPAIFQILKKAGHSRCMWGTDFPIANGRGKAFSLGNTFQWLYERDLNALNVAAAWPIAIETLMAIRQACLMADMTPTQVEDIFCNNAMRLFHGA